MAAAADGEPAAGVDPPAELCAVWVPGDAPGAGAAPEGAAGDAACADEWPKSLETIAVNRLIIDIPSGD
jgi:hypothetical protein